MEHRMPQSLTYDQAAKLYPFYVMSGNGQRITPTELCKPGLPIYEWTWTGQYRGEFCALPRTGGKMAPIVEAVDA